MPTSVMGLPPSPDGPTPKSIFTKTQRKSYGSASSYLAAVSDADVRSRDLKTSISSDTTTVVGDEDDKGTLSQSPVLDEVPSTIHAEFGHCNNEEYRYTSAYKPGDASEVEFDDPPYYILISVYTTFLLVICLSHMRDFFGKRFRPHAYRHLMAHNGYAPLNSDFDSFYTRRFKGRIDDCFSQPVTGVAGRTIVILNRTTPDYNATFTLTGARTRTLNVSSYNYLGFAQAQGGCADAVEEALRRYGVFAGGARLEGGSGELHVQAEALVARFVGREDALISSMGYATNATVIPALVGRGCLVISDELNHTSIRTGVRYSGADVRTFKHNDMRSLEKLLREVIPQGQPRTHRPWRKILIIVEGLYSMEGTLVNLPGILALKKRYKFCLFVDEAHSVGALGPHGRGVCDYFDIDPRSVDILMGTFTKSFGAAGGYVAGTKELIDSIRVHGHSGAYAESMAPPVLAQVVASMASIMGVAAPLPSPSKTPRNSDLAIAEPTHPCAAPAASVPAWMALPPAFRDGSAGRTRLRRLAFNARYLHGGLKRLGFITYGHPASPIVPLLLFNLGKLPYFHRMMQDRAAPIVVVVVAYPATSLVTGRVRFCLSAAHTKADVDEVLRACDEIGDVLDLKHGKGERWPLERILDESVQLPSTIMSTIAISPNSKRKRSAKTYVESDEEDGYDRELVSADGVNGHTLAHKASPSKKARSSGATLDSPRKTKSLSPRKNTKPPATDPTTWRQSQVPSDKQITAGDARQQYRLHPADLKHLEKDLVPAGKYIAYLYNEREVERVAWSKHGSPEGWDAYLQNLRTRHQNSTTASENAFHEPTRYGAVVSTPPSDLEQLEAQFPQPWIFSACLKFLEPTSDEELYFYNPNGFLKTALLDIKNGLLRHPPRPDSRLPSSLSVDQLRDVLQRAPRKPESGDDVPPGMLSYHSWPDPETQWMWAPEYLDEVNEALISLINEHGIGKAGWNTARWEVYDKVSPLPHLEFRVYYMPCSRFYDWQYAECVEGIHYHDDRDCKQWFDGAHFWLVGKLPRKDYRWDHRSGEMYGEAYNNLLPSVSSRRGS
ncbi:hypothetical protein HWV62_405 [Athelia sp. TMB]|nr:hypothetical protein HWV62_405 [Athelia sp. TMB]